MRSCRTACVDGVVSCPPHGRRHDDNTWSGPHLRTSAAYEAKDQIQAVEDSLKNLETAISNVSSGGEAAVVTAAATVVSSGSALVQSLQDIDSQLGRIPAAWQPRTVNLKSIEVR
jgi:hypothetical protein